MIKIVEIYYDTNEQLNDKIHSELTALKLESKNCNVKVKQVLEHGKTDTVIFGEYYVKIVLESNE
jgi:hypothetical protein